MQTNTHAHIQTTVHAFIANVSFFSVCVSTSQQENKVKPQRIDVCIVIMVCRTNSKRKKPILSAERWPIYCAYGTHTLESEHTLTHSLAHMYTQTQSCVCGTCKRQKYFHSTHTHWATYIIFVTLAYIWLWNFFCRSLFFSFFSSLSLFWRKIVWFCSRTHRKFPWQRVLLFLRFNKTHAMTHVFFLFFSFVSLFDFRLQYILPRQTNWLFLVVVVEMSRKYLQTIFSRTFIHNKF